MQWFSTDSTPAVFAFGSHPTGIVAVGQCPVGVIAIGQLARGVLVVGQLGAGVVVVAQLAVGLAGIGQLVFFPLTGIGMLGITGRGRGWVLSLLPRWRRAQPAPAVDVTDEAELLAGRRSHGWLPVRLDRGALVTAHGTPLVGEAPARIAAGTLAEVVHETVDVAADFRAPARATQLRVVALRPPAPPIPGHFLAGGLWGGGPSSDAKAPASATAARIAAWCIFATIVVGVLGLVFDSIR